MPNRADNSYAGKCWGSARLLVAPVNLRVSLIEFDGHSHPLG